MVIVMGLGVVTLGCRSTDTGNQVIDGTPSQRNTNVVESSETPRRGGRLVYGLTSETNGWNPGTNQWASSGLQVAFALFDTLTAFDADGNIHPNVFSGFEHSTDFQTWTMTVRGGITYTNGKPVDAASVAQTQRLLQASPITGSVYRLIDSITSEGTDKVVFHSTAKWTQLPMAFASQVGVVVDPDWLATNDSLHPVGTGPFVLDTWQVGSKLIATKNPHYWRTDDRGTPMPYLDSVEFRVITDTNSRSDALQTGDIDIMESDSGPQVRHFQDMPEFQVMTDPKAETREIMIQLNLMAAPFDDPDARRALAYATDKDQYIDVITEGVNPPADSFLAQNSRWYVDSGYPRFDTTKAQELVDKVKASHGGKFEFTVQGPAQPEVQKGLQLLQQQWAAVGIDAHISLVEQAAGVIQVATGRYQAALWAQFDAPNPIMDAVWFDPKSATPPPSLSLNFARNADPRVTDAIGGMFASEDDAAFGTAVHDLQRLLSEDVPYVWLFHDNVAIIASTRVVNMVNYRLPDGAKGMPLVQGAHPVAQIWLRS